MFINKKAERRFDKVDLPHVKDVEIHWAVKKEDGAPGFALRIFKMKPGGEVGLHDHDYEHEVYVISGQGELLSEKGTEKFETGDVIFVEPGITHGFRNTGEDTLEFVCVIPC